MRAKEEAFRVLEGALSVASSKVDDAEVAILGGDFESTRFEDNGMVPAHERGVELMSIRVAVEGRIARAITSDLSTGGIRAAAQQVKAQVEHLPATAVGFGFPGPQTYQETDAYDPETDALRALDRERLAGQAIMVALRHRLLASGTIVVQRGGFDRFGQPRPYAVANTRGLLAYHPQTKVKLQYAVRSPEGMSGWAEDAAFTVAALEPEELLEGAVARANRRLPRRSVPAGDYPAVLEPSAVGCLLTHLGAHVGASAVAAGASFLSATPGRQVAADGIHLYDDHAHPLHRGGPFDDEGVARRRVSIIADGRSGDPVYSWSSAQRFSGEPTGHGGVDATGAEVEQARHLVLEGDTYTPRDLMGTMGHGIVVARLGASRTVDPRSLTVEGTTRRGLFLVEDGEIVAPLSDMRFSMSVIDVLREAGARSGASWAGGTVAPAVQTRFVLTGRA